ncbi:heme o synthase [Candidatus Chloroploca sp. M-50]|uniref:Protoheme IX farnesyltransferase n=1 Tax=Candidatus Chloroploca mongolica TaxID=2528176 RepID=A0ABS4DB52_9CHLR|nr:heme o synthase [Candidatus Chloroploca mongolica]MBP1466514.1 heme o synthase [Candidatus Chloroploca mongolica]
MPDKLLRRSTVIGSLLTLVAIVSGGLVSATESAAVCTGWPLCAELFTGPATPALWVAFGHRILVAFAMVVALFIAAMVWRRPDLERWVRLPLLIAPLFGLVEVAAGGIMVALGLYEAINLAHLGLALLMLGAQAIGTAALLQPLPAMRAGGRATREARRLSGLAWWTAGATGVLALALSARILGDPAASAASALPINAGGALAMAGMLASGTFWQTWRSRRGDSLLIGVAAAVLLLILIEIPLILLPPAAAGMGVGLAALVWGATLALAVLALRRPLPATMPVVAARPATDEAPPLWKDYLSLTKPKVISLLLVTTAGAMYLTEAGSPSLWLVFWTMIGGYLAAGGAGAINCAFDSDIDINMGRTSRRPVPSGRISRRNAMIFGFVLSALSVVVMLVFTTPLAALVSTLGIFYYAWFYTQWLKRSTWQNIVIGGGAGALPPLVGWTAVTGELSVAALLLFAIVFYWTPPHFWALALVKQKDYARAGVPMLPVVAGEGETRWQILVYSVILVALSLLLTAIGAMGWIYFGGAALLGALFLQSAWHVWKRGDQASIWGLYKYSLLYLALLFVVMVIDRVMAW